MSSVTPISALPSNWQDRGGNICMLDNDPTHAIKRQLKNLYRNWMLRAWLRDYTVSQSPDENSMDLIWNNLDWRLRTWAFKPALSDTSKQSPSLNFLLISCPRERERERERERASEKNVCCHSNDESQSESQQRNRMPSKTLQFVFFTVQQKTFFSHSIEHILDLLYIIYWFQNCFHNISIRSTCQDTVDQVIVWYTVETNNMMTHTVSYWLEKCLMDLDVLLF